MYGGSHKAGRGGGGGRGGGKRGGYSSLGTPNRLTSSGGRPRLSSGGSTARGRNPSATKPVASAAVDETFTLVPGDRQLSFAATLRLPPDLLDEIKRVESQGGVARMKFDPNPINGPGNVIDVGGKEFRFTWSREMGDLCDIYEEYPDGEDSSGLLVESGCAWRKLNVQRTLDESTKNHLKMRSEEADRKSRARKTVILDPANPSMKSQIKALSASVSDAGPWKSSAQKKEPPPKKRKIESSQVGGPPKVGDKSGFPSTNSARGRLSTSSVPSPPGRLVSSASPSAMGNLGKSRGITGFGTPSHGHKEDSNLKPEKELHGKASTGVSETLSRWERENTVPTDLQSTLINVLKDKPSGMSLKAVEMAIRDTFHGSSTKIEPILKKIATLKTPGRYILNSEIELEGSKRCSPGEISPEANGNKPSLPGENIVASLAQNSSRGSLEHEATFNSIFGEDHDSDEKLEIAHHFPNPVADKYSDRQVGGNSGSDSDSDSDSRSNSGSRAGTASGSSSDSESDSAHNSKEGSDVDVDVDILGDDEEEAKETQQVPAPNFSSSPVPWISSDERPPVQNVIVQREDELGSEDVEIDKDTNIDDDDDDIDVGTAMDLIPDADPKSIDDFRPTSPNHGHGEHWNANRNEIETTSSVSFGHGDSDHSYRSRSKSRKGPSRTHDEGSADLLRTLDCDNPAKSPVKSPARYEESNMYGGSLRAPSAKPGKDSHNTRMDSRHSKDDIVDPVPRGGSVLESQQTDRRALPSVGSQHLLTEDRSTTQSHGMTNQEKNHDLKESLMKQKDVHKAEDTNSHVKTKKCSDSTYGNKHHQSKHHEQGRPLHVHPSTSSPKDAYRADVDKLHHGTGRSKVLHRELSEPELGEFREPSSEEPDGLKKRFDRKGSFQLLATDMGSLDGTLNANHIGGPCPNPGKTSSKKELLPVVNNGADLEGYGETRKKSHSSRQIKDSKQERASNSRKGSKSQKENPLEKGVDNLRETPSIEGANANQKKNESSSDESTSFSKYEKEEPDLRGPIKDSNQYEEYVQEYNEKYSIYSSLYKILENYSHKFNNLGKDLDSAKGRDAAKYQKILRQLKESYCQDGEKHKRLKKIFVVLHEELKQLKQRIKDFFYAQD